MGLENEKPKNESQQPLTPAGEATGSDLPPEGQGGPHLPAVDPLPARPLSEQFESEPPATEPLVEPHPGLKTPQVSFGHKCSVCQGPDHRACGCEAKASIDNNLEKELDSEELHVDEILEKVFGKDMNTEIARMAGEMSGALMGGSEKFEEFKSAVLDKLSDINSNLEILVKLEKDRADLLKDIKNAGANQN